MHGECMDTECESLCQEKKKCMEHKTPNTCIYDSIGNICNGKEITTKELTIIINVYIRSLLNVAFPILDNIFGCPSVPKIQITFVVDASIDDAEFTKDALKFYADTAEIVTEVYGDPEFAITSFAGWDSSIAVGSHDDKEGCYKVVQTLTTDITKIIRANVNYLTTSPNSTNGVTALAWTAMDRRIGWKMGKYYEDDEGEDRPLVKVVILIGYNEFQEDYFEASSSVWGKRTESRFDRINTCQLNKQVTLEFAFDVFTESDVAVIAIIEEDLLTWQDLEFPFFLLLEQENLYDYVEEFTSLVAKKANYNPKCFRITCRPTPKLQIAFVIDASIHQFNKNDNQTTLDAFHAVLTFTDEIKKLYGDPEFAVTTFSNWGKSVYLDIKDASLHNDEEGCYKLVQGLTLDTEKIKQANITFLPNPFDSIEQTALAWTAADTRLGWREGNFFQNANGRNRPLVRLMILIERVILNEENGNTINWKLWGNRKDTNIDGINTCQLNKESTPAIVYNSLTKHDVAVLGLGLIEEDQDLDDWIDKFEFPFFHSFRFSSTMYFDFLHTFNTLVANKINTSPECFRSCPPTPKLQIVFVIDVNIDYILFGNKTTIDAFKAAASFTDDIKKLYGDPEFAITSFAAWDRSVFKDKAKSLHNDKEGCYKLVQKFTMDNEKMQEVIEITLLTSQYVSNAGTALAWTAADTRIGWRKENFFESEKGEKRPIVRMMIVIDHRGLDEDNGTRLNRQEWGNRANTIADGINTCQSNKEATLPHIYDVLTELDVVVMGLLDKRFLSYWRATFQFPFFEALHFIDRKSFDFMSHFNELVAAKAKYNPTCFQ
ncbi:unnamed protein product [Orchesella dallaii]|uniref:VWFA domain-containing protein n=1 Tax=Orchesella dallaii TaxID=48710 RepID=A0ABP1S9Y9_9HEXA